MAKILMIGGGVSGLSAGIYAQLNGHHAIVCEKHFVAGGNLTGWDRGEYHMDNCIHWLTGTNPATTTYKMWEELGALGDVEVFQGESLYTCECNGTTLSLYKDLYRIEQEMLELSPKDKKEIQSLIRAIEIVQGICGIAGEKHSEKLTAKGTIFGIPALMKYYALTTGELAARFSHPLLRSFISAFWGDDFGSLALLMVFAHFCGENGGIPKGGSCAMAERMSERLKSLGGELLLQKEAVKINHENGRAESVTFADGTTIDADYVILTADPAVVFKKMLDIPMPKQLKKQYQNSRLRRFSSYQCAFACDLAELPFQGDFIFEVPVKYRSMLHMNQVIVREFSHEPSFAPEGKNILQTLTFCYEEDAVKFIEFRNQDKQAYKKKKQEIADLLMHLLVEKFPQLQGKLTCVDVWTPATYQRYTDSEMGSYMSFALPSKVLPTRASNRVQGLSNVFLATQWQQIPGGLPVAAEGGKMAIETIQKEIKVKANKSKYKKILLTSR
ncbi:MAG: NAD(P)/FAD-dependent oxidoreductase [Clostridia bacterium]|nr:NAD(P)/FAD-dependent oxidoreductase [Clostridia bacterium]